MSNPFEVVTTVLTAAAATPPANAYDLTDLATVHDELAIPTATTNDDGFLRRALTQVSNVIAHYCNRVFQVEAVQDEIFLNRALYGRPASLTAGQNNIVQLSRWPLVNTGYAAFTGSTHTSTTIDTLSSLAGLSAGLLVFGSGVPAGDTIATVGGSSITLTTAATATAAGVSFTTGINVVETAGDGTTSLLVQGVDYIVRADTGQLVRLNSSTGMPQAWPARIVTVQYQAGYASIPSDVVDATLRLVTARYRARGRDPMLRTDGEPGLGQQTFWVGSIPGQRGSLAPEIADIIENYRVPTT